MTAVPRTETAAVDIGMLSTRGPRSENQDAVGARVPAGILLARKGVAVAIADGVSAAEAGRVAAEASVQNFLADFYATPDAWSIRRSGAQILNALNRWLLGQGLRIRDTQRGYVATFTGAVLHARQLHVFHVGDTRLYRLRDGHLDLLTRDHRVLLADGHPALTRAMGLDHRLDIDYGVHTVATGDSYIWLTDGIHDAVDHATIARLVMTATDCARAAAALVAAARASADNTSAIVLKVNRLPDDAVHDVLADWAQLPMLPLLSPGQRIDGLIVERVLGESPRSQAYRVREEAGGAIRVLKSPSPRRDDTAAMQREYATESWVLRRVQHPRLVRGVEPPQPRSALYVLVEPVDGISLRRWLHEHPQPPVADALQIVRQVAVALRALHRRDILHRDVRPENILLDANGQVTLIDLGHCRVAGLADMAGSEDGPGALEYAAPEYACAPGRVGEAADQFALAVVLFEMLTGRLPWHGEIVAVQQGRARRQLRWQPASELNPMVPAWLDEALARALALDPSHRHGDIAAFAAALSVAARAVVSKVPKQKPLLERNPLRFWQGLAVTLLLTQVATAVLWLLNG